MINLRYHIVSITAVFLALAIGIAMGTTFIDRATVSTLKARLDDLSHRIDESQKENSTLGRQVEGWVAIDDEFAVEAGPLISDALEAVPLLVVATQGVDGESLEEVRSMLAAAGADVQGTLWLTERLALDDEDEVTDLARTVDLPGAGVGRLRTEVVTSLGAVLGGATSGSVSTSTSSVPPGATDGHELVQGLLDEGFLELEEFDGESIEISALPSPGTRYLVISGPGARVPDADITVPLLELLSAIDGAAPVVAAQATVDAVAGDVANRTLFVGPVREHETMSERVSTIDDLELSMGQVATVLAVAAAGRGETGHYGVGAGRQRLFPALEQG